MNLCFVTLLWAIAAVETGHDDAAIGRAGERSQYQIMEVVWRQHEPQPASRPMRGPSRNRRRNPAPPLAYEAGRLGRHLTRFRLESGRDRPQETRAE
jgi:hypothetical protein